MKAQKEPLRTVLHRKRFFHESIVTVAARTGAMD